MEQKRKKGGQISIGNSVCGGTPVLRWGEDGLKWLLTPYNLYLIPDSDFIM